MCFERRFSKKNRVIRVKSIILARKNFFGSPKFWPGYATVVSICILSGDGGWQVRLMLKRRGARTSLWDTVLEASWPTPFAISGGKGKTTIANHLHDHVDHVSIRQQSQQLAGEAAVPYSVVGCCEVDKHSSGLLFSWKAILDDLCQQGDLVYGRPPVSKARLLLWEQWVNDWFNTSSGVARGGRGPRAAL